MAFGFLYFIAGVFLLVVIGLIIVLIYFLTRKKIDTRIRLETFIPIYSNGNTDLIIKDIKMGENNRIRIEAFYEDENNKKEDYILYFDKRQIESIPVGGFDMTKGKIKAYPTDISLLPEGIKDTRYGKSIMQTIEKNNELKDESELMRMRMNNLQKISEQEFGGKIFTDYMDIATIIIKDKTDLTKKEEKKFGETK